MIYLSFSISLSIFFFLSSCISMNVHHKNASIISFARPYLTIQITFSNAMSFTFFLFFFLCGNNSIMKCCTTTGCSLIFMDGSLVAECEQNTTKKPFCLQSQVHERQMNRMRTRSEWFLGCGGSLNSEMNLCVSNIEANTTTDDRGNYGNSLCVHNTNDSGSLRTGICT